jgi:hypothetical protein
MSRKHTSVYRGMHALAKKDDLKATLQGLQDGKWMQGIQRMATTEEIQRFITLWTLVAQVWRNEELDGLEHMERACKFIYTVWNIWKERCRRLYDNKAMTTSQLQTIIRLDVELYNTSRWIPLYGEIRYHTFPFYVFNIKLYSSYWMKRQNTHHNLLKKATLQQSGLKSRERPQSGKLKVFFGSLELNHFPENWIGWN